MLIKDGVQLIVQIKGKRPAKRCCIIYKIHLCYVLIVYLSSVITLIICIIINCRWSLSVNHKNHFTVISN